MGLLLLKMLEEQAELGAELLGFYESFLIEDQLSLHSLTLLCW